MKEKPVTRAVRAALAISVTAFALSGSGIAYAGTCTANVADTIFCDGSFNNTITFPDADLTLVLGQNAPTSVTVGSFMDGIDADWSGDVSVLSFANITTAGGDGIRANGSMSADIENHGRISVGSPGLGNYVTGIDVTGGAGGVTVDNTGTITAMSHQGATGIFAEADSGGDVSIINSGDIVVGNAQTGFRATGILASTSSSHGNVLIDNSGTVRTTDLFGSGGLAAVAQGPGSNATIRNSGEIHVHTLGAGAESDGIFAYATSSAHIDNSGSVELTNVDHGYGAFARAAGNAGVSNSGDISLDFAATASHGFGIVVESQANATVSNSGSIRAIGGTSAMSTVGIVDNGITSATVANTGEVVVVANNAEGIVASGNHATIDNGITGNIDVHSVNGAEATGLGSFGEYAAVDSAGDVSVDGFQEAFGIRAIADFEANISNSGAVEIAAYQSGYGLVASSGFSVLIGNTGTGTIDVHSATGTAFGMEGITTHGDVSIDNAGAVSVTAGGFNSHAAGLVAQAANGNISIDNNGAITESSYSLGYGVFAKASGDVQIDNAGSIYTNATGFGSNSYGIFAIAGGAATVDNSGVISVVASRADSDAFGVYAQATTGDAYVSNSGTIQVVDFGSAVGVLARSTGGSVSVVNAGPITATGFNGQSIGIYGYSSSGDVSIATSGDVTSYNISAAYGALAVSGSGQVSVSNAGNIAATGYFRSTGLGAVTTGAGKTATVANGGTVTVGAHGVVLGLHAAADGNASIDNQGSVSVTYGQDSFATLARSENGDASVTNSGAITVVASEEGFGINALARIGAVNVDNSGTITVNTGDQSSALGIQASGYTAATVTNSGAITVGSNFYAVGVKTVSFMGDASAVNNGSITVTSGDLAYGILVAGQTASVVNDGYIAVTGYARTVAIDLFGAQNTVTNSGSIVANSTSSSLEGNVAIRGRYDGVDRILNYGDIHGAVVTNDGDDLLFNGNGGVWTINNHSTDFGDGDDTIINGVGGTIRLNSGAISLGANSSAGNVFNNAGTISVSGNNLIDMGSDGSVPPPEGTLAPTAVPSLNPLPLANNGTIDFQDGTPDDTLTIIGDLGGSGAINLDVSVLNNASDMLYIDGSIAPDTVQTVNIEFDAFPTSFETLIPFARVTGNATDGAFVAGQMNGLNANGNFVDLQLDIVSQIDPTNASDDVFAIGLDVAGLNDDGVLAASVASGVRSLISSQVGTWRQRMGVLPDKAQGAAGLSPWVRAFTDQGEIDPTHVAANFGQAGNFRYNQTNAGQEIGVNVNPGNLFNFGLLLGKSDASQRLIAPAMGTDRIHATTVGLYGTWVSPKGYYIDTSYRWLHFDADLRSIIGEQATTGYANALNLEVGYDAWTLSGGTRITPQAQYTRARVGAIEPIAGDGADFESRGGYSSRARLGVAMSKSITGGSGVVWTPYGSVNAVREFDGQARYAIGNIFFGQTSTEGTSAMVEMGLSAQKGAFSVTGGINWTDGGALNNFTGGQVSVRYSW